MRYVYLRCGEHSNERRKKEESVMEDTRSEEDESEVKWLKIRSNGRSVQGCVDHSTGWR